MILKINSQARAVATSSHLVMYMHIFAVATAVDILELLRALYYLASHATANCRLAQCHFIS